MTSFTGKKVHDGYGNNPADRDLNNPFSRIDRFIRWRHGDGRDGDDGRHDGYPGWMNHIVDPGSFDRINWLCATRTWRKISKCSSTFNPSQPANA